MAESSMEFRFTQLLAIGTLSDARA